MTRKSRSLLITFILLLVVGGGLILLRTTTNPEPIEAPAAERTAEILSSFEPGDLRSVRIRRGEDEVHLYSADGEQWRVADVPEFYRPYTERVLATVQAFSSLRSGNVISDDVRVSELKDFGLVSPAALLELKDRNGRIAVVEIGIRAPSGAGRYARVEGSSTVVLLPDSIAEQAFVAAEGYRDMRLPAVNLESMSVMEFRHEGEIVRIEPRVAEDPYITLASPYDITSPWKSRYPLDEYEFNSILTEEAPLPVEVEEFRDDLDPGDPSLNLGGESSDSLLVSDTEGNTLSLIIGAPDGRGRRYVRFGDRTDAVFLLDESNLALVNTEPFRLLSKFIFLGSILQVGQVKVEYGRKTWIMNRMERGDPKDSKDDRFDVNGLEMPHKGFTEVYQRFISIMWEGEVERPTTPESPELRITVSGVEPGVAPKVIRYWPYDDVYYQVSLDDGPLEFLAGRYQVTEFIADLEALAELAG